MNKGAFVISLDFELMWGVRDKRSIESYGDNIKAVHEIVPRLLDLFSQSKVGATWATVGFLFCENREEMQQFSPGLIPSYTLSNLNPYPAIDHIGFNDEDDRYHYAHQLVNLIRETKYQELASHTFSHFYCLEEGQNSEVFAEDLKAAQSIARKRGSELKSLVFPRNQFNKPYLEVCKNHGITTYRGNQEHWLYRARNKEGESQFRRAIRLLDAYINISGHNCHNIIQTKHELVNIPASRFLRPASSKLKALESLRLNRILKDMEHAAKNNLVYHLWWHPHNFGSNTEANFSFLQRILMKYQELHLQYGFQSKTMASFTN